MQPHPLSQEYERRISGNMLVMDAAQKTVLERLEPLKTQLETPKRWSLFKKAPAPRGVYLWGGVGRGKSMVMDLFFASVDIPLKRRIHFHAFMLEVHARIHAFRKTSTSEKNPVVEIAHAIAHDAQLLYLDEFQVQDVADAMILSQLFGSLFERGVTVVMTSNREPGDLYQGGLQRDRFLRFVDVLREHVDVVELQSAEDYRMRQLKALERTYHYPLGLAADSFIAQIQARFGAKETEQTLDVGGRQITIATLDSKTAIASFAELCAQPLGAADYLAIAQTFEILVLKNIPKLNPEKRNEAKRFVTLIDTLYEQKVKLIATADAPPAQLYPAGDGVFEFGRTVSRLMEMQSERYLGTSHTL